MAHNELRTVLRDLGERACRPDRCARNVRHIRHLMTAVTNRQPPHMSRCLS